ncbi:UNVERIFIED_CONTAM: Exocyst complex component SEC3A [Sesamum calycinum]|uniref:Exocyst complex component SEC3A n=1 Tax=Sesamum calycinum TaxID=2727403 RepID=A0AAW2P8R0_9LAMI
MARSSADDEQLRRACEMAIEDETVVMSIRVVKSGGIWGKPGKLGLRHMAKPRVLAISTKVKGKRTKAFLRVLKYSNGGYLEAAKMYKLKHLSKVEVSTDDPSGCTFMLGFDNLRSQSVAPPQWTMRNVDDRNRLVLCILNISKDCMVNIPKVVGIDVVEMALWAKYASCLTGGSFDEANMHENLEACEWLAIALQALEVPNLDRCYAKLRSSSFFALFMCFEVPSLQPGGFADSNQSAADDYKKMGDNNVCDIGQNFSSRLKICRCSALGKLCSISEQGEFLDKYASFVQLVVKVYPTETIPAVQEMGQLLASM